jgi:hypothetical protein
MGDDAMRMYEMQVCRDVVVDMGKARWESLRPLVPATAPPYRYDRRIDAEGMLERLYSHLPLCCRRVVQVH